MCTLVSFIFSFLWSDRAREISKKRVDKKCFTRLLEYFKTKAMYMSCDSNEMEYLMDDSPCGFLYSLCCFSGNWKFQQYSKFPQFQNLLPQESFWHLLVRIELQKSTHFVISCEWRVNGKLRCSKCVVNVLKSSAHFHTDVIAKAYFPYVRVLFLPKTLWIKHVIQRGHVVTHSMLFVRSMLQQQSIASEHSQHFEYLRIFPSNN